MAPKEPDERDGLEERVMDTLSDPERLDELIESLESDDIVD